MFSGIAHGEEKGSFELQRIREPKAKEYIFVYKKAFLKLMLWQSKPWESDIGFFLSSIISYSYLVGFQTI